jgi:dehydrogenase/reductase SDR family member 12
MIRKRHVSSRLADAVDIILDASVAGGYSRLGYALRSRLLPEFTAAEPQLIGRTVLLTGATSGIGLAAATRLASRGAKVQFLARNAERAERTRRQLGLVAARSGFDPGAIGYGIADLDDLDSVRAFARRIASRLPELDVLIHNAGAINPAFERTAGGLERTISAQVVAPFLLTYELFELLRGSEPAAVITVSSGGMYTQALNVTSLEAAAMAPGYRGVTAYAKAKRAQVALSAEWARRAAGTGVSFHAMHPGWARTPGITQSLKVFSTLMGPVLRTPEQGADTIAWLAETDQIGSGKFWHDRRRRPVNRFAGARPDPPDAARRLWDWVAEKAGVDPDRLPGAAR